MVLKDGGSDEGELVTGMGAGDSVGAGDGVVVGSEVGAGVGVVVESEAEETVAAAAMLEQARRVSRRARRDARQAREDAEVAEEALRRLRTNFEGLAAGWTDRRTKILGGKRGDGGGDQRRGGGGIKSCGRRACFGNGARRG